MMEKYFYKQTFLLKFIESKKTIAFVEALLKLTRFFPKFKTLTKTVSVKQLSKVSISIFARSSLNILEPNKSFTILFVFLTLIIKIILQ